MTETEKFECTVMWLNALYRAFWEEEFKYPCQRCPHLLKKCVRKEITPQDNFKVLEQFTGENSVVGRVINSPTRL